MTIVLFDSNVRKLIYSVLGLLRLDREVIRFLHFNEMYAAFGFAFDLCKLHIDMQISDSDKSE
jgi:hypothetical protein